MARVLYKGFSTFNFQKTKDFLLTDVDLVEYDLLSHIFTRIGERIDLPDFGTIIPDLIFEPLDDTTISIVYSELKRVFAFDPRVEVIYLTVDPSYDNNSLICVASLRYIELNMTKDLTLNLDFQDQ